MYIYAHKLVVVVVGMILMPKAVAVGEKRRTRRKKG
jgi:hypothetical protein